MKQVKLTANEIIVLTTMVSGDYFILPNDKENGLAEYFVIETSEPSHVHPLEDVKSVVKSLRKNKLIKRATYLPIFYPTDEGREAAKELLS